MSIDNTSIYPSGALSQDRFGAWDLRSFFDVSFDLNQGFWWFLACHRIMS